MQRCESELSLLRRERFLSFDGAVSLSTWHQRPDRYRHLEREFGGRACIARGGGYSYSAASFGEDIIVQQMTTFDRLLAYDEEAATVRVEAGLTLDRLVAWAASRRRQVPVLPGYPLITVGGCIAADVHGKNPVRDGTFSDWVEAMTLYNASRGFQTITRLTHPELFEATCGGFGLTGVIVDATLRLAPLPAPNVRVEAVPVASIVQALERFTESNQSDFVYSWHDGAARGTAFGRGIVFRGSWTDAPCHRPRPAAPMSADSRGRIPWSLWNRWTVPAANAWFRLGINRAREQVKTAFDAAFPFARQTLYHRFFGRPGLAEVQVLVPHVAVLEFVERMRDLVHRVDPLVVMISTKRFVGRQRSLSMSGEGVLFALDLGRTERTPPFLAAFDALAIEMKAQPNIAKDSRLPGEVAAKTLPGFELFRQQIARLDPARRYRSELSQRLGL